MKECVELAALVWLLLLMGNAVGHKCLLCTSGGEEVEEELCWC